MHTNPEVYLINFILSLHGVVIAITKVFRTRVISVEEFKVNAPSLVGKKVRLTGRIEPNLRETSHTCKRCMFSVTAIVGDTLECNLITGNAKLVENIEEKNTNDEKVESLEISLQGICCWGKEVITYKAGGRILNIRGSSRLCDEERETAFRFDFCRFRTKPLKINSLYTVTGIVLDREKSIQKKLDQYFHLVNIGNYINSSNRYYIMVTEINCLASVEECSFDHG